jgi:hypothetical protein
VSGGRFIPLAPDGGGRGGGLGGAGGGAQVLELVDDGAVFTGFDVALIVDHQAQEQALGFFTGQAGHAHDVSGGDAAFLPAQLGQDQAFLLARIALHAGRTEDEAVHPLVEGNLGLMPAPAVLVQPARLAPQVDRREWVEGPEQRFGDDPQDHADGCARTFVAVTFRCQRDHQSQEGQGVADHHDRHPGADDEAPDSRYRLDDGPSYPPVKPGFGWAHQAPRERIEDLALAGGGQVPAKLGGQEAQALLGVPQGKPGA